MFPIPEKFALVAGKGEGTTELTAFDSALDDAGVAHYNLVKMSSIMPPGARPSATLREEVPAGSLLPMAYGFIVCDHPGETISAAVAVGLTGTTYGLIMEHKRRAPRETVEAEVVAMVREGLVRRGLPVERILVLGSEHRVEKVGCAFAGIAIWK